MNPSGTSITLVDELSPLLARLSTEASINGLSMVIGRAASNEVREHFFALNSARHRFGRNYYAGAARGTSFAVTPEGPRISTNQVGIRQRRFGGPIRPSAGKQFLTIPATPEAVGKRAGEFSDLDVARVLDPESGRLRWALVRRASTAISFAKRKAKDGSVRLSVKSSGLNQGGQVMFWLVRKVEQRADPSVLPTPARLQEIVLGAALTRVNRLKFRAGQTPGGAS